jgi:hypothetical protein
MNLKGSIRGVVLAAIMTVVALGFAAAPIAAEDSLDKEILRETCADFAGEGGGGYTYWENSNGEYGCDYKDKNGNDQTIICVEGGDHCLKLFDNGTQQAGGQAAASMRPAPGGRRPALNRPQPNPPGRLAPSPLPRPIVR